MRILEGNVPVFRTEPRRILRVLRAMRAVRASTRAPTAQGFASATGGTPGPPPSSTPCSGTESAPWRPIGAVFLGGLLLAACSSSSQQVAEPAAAFRATPPAAGAPVPLEAPKAERTVLDNGLTVITVQKAGLPLTSVELVLARGAAYDPAGKEGLAGFTADALKSGTQSRNATQIAREVETLGSSLSVSVDEDSTSLGFTSLTENLGPILDVMTDVLLHPAFEAEELEKVRRRRQASLAEALDDPGQVASMVFRKHLFGEHPYAHPTMGTEDGLKAVTGQDVRAFYRVHYRPDTAAVIVVGDLTTEGAVDLVRSRLSQWEPAAATAGGAGEVPAPKAGSVGTILVDKRNAPQSQIRVGHLGVKRDHPDYFPLVMMNATLGGLFNSRINMNLREDKGYTYGARSVFDFMRRGGSFFVYTAVRTDVTKPAIEEVLAEIERMRQSGVTDEELSSARNRYSLSLPGYFQTVDGIAGMLSNVFVYGLPLDYYDRLPERLAAVTVDDVQRVAQRHLHPERLSLVVVGDVVEVKAPLSQLGRGLELRNARGELEEVVSAAPELGVR